MTRLSWSGESCRGSPAGDPPDTISFFFSFFFKKKKKKNGEWRKIGNPKWPNRNYRMGNKIGGQSNRERKFGNGPNAKWEIINLLLSDNKRFKRIKVQKSKKNKQNVKTGKVRKIRKVKEKKTLAIFFGFFLQPPPFSSPLVAALLFSFSLVELPRRRPLFSFSLAESPRSPRSTLSLSSLCSPHLSASVPLSLRPMSYPVPPSLAVC
jgi:hypothetical protein